GFGVIPAVNGRIVMDFSGLHEPGVNLLSRVRFLRLFEDRLTGFGEDQNGDLFALSAGPNRAALQEPLGAKRAQIVPHLTFLALVSILSQIGECDGPKASDIAQRFKLRGAQLADISASA